MRIITRWLRDARAINHVTIELDKKREVPPSSHGIERRVQRIIPSVVELSHRSSCRTLLRCGVAADI